MMFRRISGPHSTTWSYFHLGEYIYFEWLERSTRAETLLASVPISPNKLDVLFLNERVRPISQGATVQESGVVFFRFIPSVRFVFKARIELHQHEHHVCGQEWEICGRVRDDEALRGGFAR